MSANSNEAVVENTSENLVCESCGESFSCGSKLGKCWCFEIEIDKDALENLKTGYKNCLCEKCLTGFQLKV